MTDCPAEYVGGFWEVIEYAELFEKGLPPIAGGAMDQTRWFVSACRLIWADQAYWKRQLGIVE